MKFYFSYLVLEMREIEGKILVILQGKQVIFRFELILVDMKWMVFDLGELINLVIYFLFFVNVNLINKYIVGGIIGGC